MEDLQQPQTITIDDKVYQIDKLSDKAKNHINDLNLIDAQLADLNIKTAVAKIAFDHIKASLDEELATYVD